MNEAWEVGVCPKLQPVFIGPYVVSGKYGPATYQLMLDGKKKTRVLHHDKLKKYVGVHPPKWVTSVIKNLKIRQK